MNIIKEIQEANLRLEGVVSQTPLQFNQKLSSRYGANILLKREDLQLVRSFKIRGAYNKMKSMPASDTQKGIVCTSAGNHAQGVAYTCASLAINGKIFMPTTTPQQKISKVKHFGGSYVDVVLTGDTFDDSQQAALAFANANGLSFIHPFNDEKVIAGQGTIATEILSQYESEIDYIIVAVGGGGLIAGVGSYIKEKSPLTKIIAVESEGASALHQSLKANKHIVLEDIDSFADGIAVKQLGDITYDIARKVVDRSLIVPEGKICSTMLALYNDDAIITEPAGAVGIAALDQLQSEIKGKTVAIIVCGGNNDINRTEDIRERALLYENKKHYFIIQFPQRAGALKDFLKVLGPKDDISHFQYTKKTNRNAGPALVGIELNNPDNLQPLISNMKKSAIDFQHINNNPMLFQLLV